MATSVSGIILLKKMACVVVLMCMVVAAPHAEAAISCHQVMKAKEECINYSRNGGAVPAACCDGLTFLMRAAATTPDRQALCECVKTIVSKIPHFNYDLLSSIPGKCGIHIPYTISPSTDCSKVH